jgi:hypothetical protein
VYVCAFVCVCDTQMRDTGVRFEDIAGMEGLVQVHLFVQRAPPTRMRAHRTT